MLNTYLFSTKENGYAKAPEYYVVRKLPVLFIHNILVSYTFHCKFLRSYFR